jgi:hypothetical protein
MKKTLEKAGDLLYCKSRTNTECCFNNHSCVGSWTEINNKFGENAVNFMKDKVIYNVQSNPIILKTKHTVIRIIQPSCLSCFLAKTTNTVQRR